MELKKGYKQTEVGAIPIDWEVDDIGNVVSITTGAKNTQDRIEDGSYPFFVRSQTIERINSYSFDGEGVLTAGDGVGTGKVFHYINGKFDFHQRVYLMSGFADHLNGYFFYLYFKNNFYNRIMQMTAKSSVDSVRMEMISKMKLPLPSIAEQTAIATALSDADALITSLEKLIAKKRNIKQGAMQQLLKPKKGWVVKKLGEIGKVIRGASPRPQGDKRFYGGSVPRLMVEDVTRDGKFVTPQVDFLTEEGAKRSRPCKKGTLTIVCSGTVGIPSILAVDACIHDGFLAIVEIQQKYSTDFLYHILTTMRSRFDNSATHGGIFTNLTTSSIKEFEIQIPELEQQILIATILSEMDNELVGLDYKLEKSKRIKQGMMQNLLTGKIRLV